MSPPPKNGHEKRGLAVGRRQSGAFALPPDSAYGVGMMVHGDSDSSRGPVVQTRDWADILKFYRERVAGGWAGEPMVRLVEAIQRSDVARQLHAAPAGQTLFLSDEPDFHLGDNTLHIRYDPETRMFDFYHQNFSGGGDRRSVNEAEVLETLSLFLEYKFGLPVEFRTAE